MEVVSAVAQDFSHLAFDFIQQARQLAPVKHVLLAHRAGHGLLRGVVYEEVEFAPRPPLLGPVSFALSRSSLRLSIAFRMICNASSTSGFPSASANFKERSNRLDNSCSKIFSTPSLSISLIIRPAF